MKALGGDSNDSVSIDEDFRGESGEATTTTPTATTKALAASRGCSGRGGGGGMRHRKDMFANNLISTIHASNHHRPIQSNSCLEDEQEAGNLRHTMLGFEGNDRRWYRQFWKTRPRDRRRFIPALLLAVITIPIAFLVSAELPKVEEVAAQKINQEYDHINADGAIIFLAPARKASSMWGIDRFCMLLRAIRSVDQHLNKHYGPYPVYVLVAKDYIEYIEQVKRYLNRTTTQQGPYSSADKALIKRWAPNSPHIEFVEFDLYTNDALEPNTTLPQIHDWRAGLDGGVAGVSLGYQSMCRLWSGRLQQSFKFMDRHQYYMRMDDDSLLLEDLKFDPFQRMIQNNLTYAYRRSAIDHWGIDKLWQLSTPFLDFNKDLPYVVRGYDGDDGNIVSANSQGQGYSYEGGQPYNNFHVSKVDFWRSDDWTQLWRVYNENHMFFKYRVGDANVHAIAMMVMQSEQIEEWSDLPYAHNSNDYGPSWGTKSWVEECQQAYKGYL